MELHNPVGKIGWCEMLGFAAQPNTSWQCVTGHSKPNGFYLCEGADQQGQPILGLHHYSGVESARDALLEMRNSMVAQGAVNFKIYLVGGSYARDVDDADSCEEEHELLARRSEFPIEGARLHLTHGECDENGNGHSAGIVVTPDRIYYSHVPLYHASHIIEIENE